MRSRSAGSGRRRKSRTSSRHLSRHGLRFTVISSSTWRGPTAFSAASRRAQAFLAPARRCGHRCDSLRRQLRDTLVGRVT